MANPILDSDLEQVLNLHRGIADRWAGPSSLNGATAGLDSAFFGTDRMLAALPGLATVNGSFGADAWDLANFLTVEGTFGRTLSAEVRFMSVGDLADIVQLILEEEELAQVEQSLHAASQRAKAQGKPLPKAGRKTARKAAPGLRRKIEAVRRSLAQVRARVAKETALQQSGVAHESDAHLAMATKGGQDAPSISATGDSVSAMPGQVGTEGPVVLGLAETLRTFSRTAAARRTDSPVSGVTRMALQSGSNWHPQATGVGVGFQATATRALRMAENAAEMAMVEPTAELLAGAPSDGVGVASSAPVAARPHLAASLFDAGTGAPALASPTSLQVARRQAPAALAREAMRQAAKAGVASQTMASAAPGRSHALSPSIAGVRSSGAPASAWGLPLPTLSGAVRLAGQQLQRHASALAAAQIHARPSPAVAAPAATTFGAGAQAPTAEQALDFAPTIASIAGPAPTFASDRFAGLLARGEADQLASSGLVPRLTRWLEAGDQLVSATGGPRTGYAAADSGAGETLQLAELPDAVPQGVARLAPPAARVHPSVAPAPTTPGWLTPATARVQAQRIATQMAATRPVAGAAMVAPTAMPGVDAAALAAVARTAALPQAWTASGFDGAIAETARLPALSAPTGAQSVAMAAADTATLPSMARPTGGTGLAAIGIAQRLAERHLGGLEPGARAPAWQPAMAPRSASAIGSAPAALADALGEAASFATRAEAPAFGMQPEWLARYDTAAPAELRGSLGHDIGAGEWLLPGDDGYEAWASQPAADAPLATPRATAQARAPIAALKPGQPGVLKSTIADRSAGAAARTLPQAATASPPTPTLARAAAAAIDHVVSRHERAQQTATHRAAQGQRAASPLSVAGLGSAMAGGDVLGLTPGGSPDAITPWLLRGALARLPAETRRALRIAGVEGGEFIDLQVDAPAPDKAGSAALTPAATAATATSISAASPTLAATPTSRQIIERRAQRQRASLVRAIERPEVQQQLRRLGSGALDVRQPAGLRAALALFGESSEGAVETEVTRSFLERWFGGSEATVRRPMKGSDVGGDLVTMSAERSAAAGTAAGGKSTLRTAGDRAMTSLATDEGFDSDAGVGSDQELVLSGLSGLNALRSMRGAGEVDAELLSTGEIRESDAPAEASAAAAGASKPASASAPAVALDRRSGGVRMHDFAPVGLGRGRRLLGRSRRGGRPSLVRGSRAARFGGRRVGYGGAGLGGGALLGLVAGDGAGDGFHGGGFGDTRMTARAERLSAAVSARREAAAGPVGRVLRPVERSAARRSGSAPAAGLPRDFQFGDASPELVSPHKAMEQAARGASASQGGTAQSRGLKAGAMARVLSVTASPTANVLPLVAPAARALASVAAAKSLDESVITSGSDPTAGTPIERQGGGGSQAQGEATTDEQGSEISKEINALAMRIARSVMVRIKRERERRGLHG